MSDLQMDTTTILNGVIETFDNYRNLQGELRQILVNAGCPLGRSRELKDRQITYALQQVIRASTTSPRTMELHNKGVTLAPEFWSRL